MVQETKKNLLFVLRMMVMAFSVTALMLLVLAFLLYKLHLSAKTVSAAVVVVYIVVTVLTGFAAGKKMKIRKFMWGLLMGILYFGILAAISFAAGHDPGGIGTDFLTTLLLCAAGGMLGGMLA